MDFVLGSLFDGRSFRSVTWVENSSRECLAIHAAARLHGSDVAEILDQIPEKKGRLVRIFLDNDPSSFRKCRTAGPTKPM